MADDAAGAVRRTPRPAEDSCRAYDVDGETVRVHGGKPLDEAGQAALGEIVRAATAKVAAEHPNLGVTQELIMAGLAATRAIPDGEVRGGCTIQDGAKVKARLKAAIGAARDALGSVAPLPRLAELAEASGKLRTAEWLRECALLPLEEWPPAPAYKGPMVPASERDALQDRVDTALQLIHVGAATGPHFLTPDETSEIRAALQGDQPTDGASQPTEPPTSEEDVRSLRLHLASVHKLANAFDLPAAELDDVHQYDHFGPCGLRNHDVADRSYDEAEARAVAAEVDGGPIGEADRG